VARALITQIRHTIAANGYRIMRDVIEHASADEARLLRVALDRSRFLSDYARNDLIGILSTTHHEVFVEVKKPWEEDIIYTTAAGLEKRQKELERIVNVELPKVAEAIGRAIAFGDVSDNAEYRFALEQRDSLSKRATAIRQEIAKARLISHGVVTGEEVTVGARVTARNQATGEVETFSFLGPWDTDIPNRVYSYQAPFSLAFMGKRQKDVVTAPGAEGPRMFEIIEIVPAI
jgi:transcription elongation GreA/GreB family factor